MRQRDDRKWEAKRRANPLNRQARRRRQKTTVKNATKRCVTGARCCDPFQIGCDEPAAEGHHILPIRERPDLATDPANLAPLCHGCHVRVEKLERKGIETQQLFGVG